MKESYPENDGFKEMWEKCTMHQDAGDLHIHKSYLMKVNQQHLPILFVMENVIQDQHGGGLGSHLGRDKILAAVEEIFYWLNAVECCQVCAMMLYM